MKIATFERVEVIEGREHKTYIHFKHPSIFLVSDYVFSIHENKQLTEITIWSLLYWILVYSFRKPYYTVLRKMRIMGFLSTPPQNYLTLKDLTLLFWKHKI